MTLRIVFSTVTAALLVSCATPSLHAAPSCTAERSVYTLRGAPDATLRLIEPPHALTAYSDLAAKVDYQGETYWFAFTSSLGYSRNYVGRTSDPFEAARIEDQGGDPPDAYTQPEYNGSEISFFNAGYDLAENIPQSGDAPPAHILASGISSAIWYSEPRRELPKAMWDFHACGEPIPPHEHGNGAR
ncbi:MAG: hypothetical protein ABW199_05855 [Caulobacterales bacterium]